MSKHKQTSKVILDNTVNRNESSVKVLCRVRPALDFENVIYKKVISNSRIAHVVSLKTIGIGQDDSLQSFTFDYVFDSDASQSEIFEYIGRPMISDIMAGYNGTIFAYGQTGSGKTFTMMGELLSDYNQGIIPKTSNELFNHIDNDSENIEYIIKISMLEIYKDNLNDLLNDKSSTLKIKQCPHKGIYVEGLNSICVTNAKELIEVVCMGEEYRTVAFTRLNDRSSRSHMLCIIEVIQNLDNGSTKKGMLNLVDLAGSEKVRNSGVTGIHLEEATKINLSLSSLGKVISALAAGKDYVPYRDSKLTRLLQESLGGNYKTSLIVCCSPAISALDETLNSLNFAVRAKAIKNKVRINIKESPESYQKTIDILRNELINTRQEMQTLKEKSFLYDNRSICTSLTHSIPTRPKKALTSLIMPKRTEKLSIESPIMINMSSDTKTFYFENDSANSTFMSPEKAAEESYHLKETIDDLYIDCKKRIAELEQEVDFYKEENKSLQEKLMSYSEKIIEFERKSVEYYSLYHKTLGLINKDVDENMLLMKKNENLTRLINQLTGSLQEMEKRFYSFVESCKYTKDATNLEFSDVHNTIMNTPQETEMDDLLVNSGELDFTLKEVSLCPERLNLKSSYGEKLQNALEKNIVLSKDIIIYHLKNQMVQAGIYNSNMAWKLESLNWKLTVLKKKLQIKEYQVNQQKIQLQNQDRIIETLSKYLKKLSKPIEKNPELLSPVSKKRKMLRSFYSKSFKSIGEPTEKSFISLGLSPSIDIDGDFITQKMKILETKLNIEETFNTQLKSAYESLQKELYEQNHLYDLSKNTLIKNFNEEKSRWGHFFNEIRANCEKELIRKQEEVRKLNELLAEWINNFMEIQEGIVTKEFHRKIQMLIINTVNFYSPSAKMNEIFSKGPFF